MSQFPSDDPVQGQSPEQGQPGHPDRREFIKTSASVAAGGLILPGVLPGVLPGFAAHVSGSDVLRVGLIGCGNRGSGAAVQALRADKGTQLVAMADAFPDRIERALGNIKKSNVADRIVVEDGMKFSGIDGYKKLLQHVDVVILTSPPHFRPEHLKAAVEAGKHVFCEKPVAVDTPGLKSVRESCDLARMKNLSLVSGLCWRYDHPMKGTFQRIHEGGVGDIVTIQATYNTHGLWEHKRQPKWTDLEWQIRNWIYFTWLSGDHIAEQHIHSLDKIAWALKDETPKKVTASGGRITRIEPRYGNVFDHFNTVYEYESGVKAFASCRQWNGASTEVNDHVYGTKGHCDVFKHVITGEKPWKYEGPRGNMYQNEHNELFASIRAGKPINNGGYMVNSTMMAIMGRMAAYTGKTITWEQAWGSTQRLGPDNYEWGPLATPPIARPGKTKFV